MKLFSLIVLLIMAASVNVSAEQSSKSKVNTWVEGGATATKGGASVAVGIRMGYFGLKFGYGGDKDYSSSDIYDAYPIAPGLLGASSKPVGKRSVSPAYGFDYMGILDLVGPLAVYGELGTYWQEQRQVRVVTGSGLTGWPVGTLYNIEPKKQEFVPAAGGGLQWRFSGWPIMLTLGYHTIRGVSGGIGFAL